MPDTYFSRFMLSEENDKEFVERLNQIKEGFIIISGLKDITESTDLNTIGSRTTTDDLSRYGRTVQCI